VNPFQKYKLASRCEVSEDGLSYFQELHETA